MTRRYILTAILGVFVLFGSVSRAAALPFSTFGEGWDGPGRGHAALTFAFGNPTLDLPLDRQRAALIAALDVWAAVVDLTFTETTLLGQPRSIDFTFQSGPGPSSNILAFAFFPPPVSEPFAGDIFFLDDWLWEVGNGLGFAAFDLQLLAIHEIGHALGLGHSTTADAVMRPFFGSNQISVGLHPDDIAGIQSLYASVPEASSGLLLIAGLSALTICRRRRVPADRPNRITI